MIARDFYQYHRFRRLKSLCNNTKLIEDSRRANKEVELDRILNLEDLEQLKRNRLIITLIHHKKALSLNESSLRTQAVPEQYCKQQSEYFSSSCLGESL
jgi:hypothetical protein